MFHSCKYVVVSVCLIVFVSLFCIHEIKTVTTVGTTPQLKRQIIIDPGHGGEDGGAEGLYQAVEKNINLDISLELADLFRASGFEVILTRDHDVSIYDDSAKSLRQKKRSDLKKRLEIANDNPQAIFISVHQNKFEQNQYSGAQIFYGEKNASSKLLAESLQQAFVANLQPENTRQVKPITSSVYLIQNAKPVAVLAECGFLSNPEESKKLLDSTYQKQVAFTLYSGILRFYEASV
ncbi:MULTISPECIES: N-acetylmuramoyl-L-alanine amidase [Clostridiaceae]|uniref:N-acetylmuramoyl-L-alanine amidase n=1 Tax=Clostridium facile TaxID=2763035 RepID=A0ABR7IR12_9CLOT|nr:MULTISPECIES: N-acetylmuramoyl-L-alanine amidase [Clostridiaceae]MBC5787566.1 N-acetylmuramoyl-L-alanine amidase [Clostridium facile]PWM99572.1 MAG: hypothetical protein DBX37_04170 [Massilioclostridium sp.]